MNVFIFALCFASFAVGSNDLESKWLKKQNLRLLKAIRALTKTEADLSEGKETGVATIWQPMGTSASQGCSSSTQCGYLSYCKSGRCISFSESSVGGTQLQYQDICVEWNHQLHGGMKVQEELCKQSGPITYENLKLTLEGLCNNRIIFRSSMCTVWDFAGWSRGSVSKSDFCAKLDKAVGGCWYGGEVCAFKDNIGCPSRWGGTCYIKGKSGCGGGQSCDMCVKKCVDKPTVVLGELGEKKCPSGYSPIYDPLVCREALKCESFDSEPVTDCGTGACYVDRLFKGRNDDKHGPGARFLCTLGEGMGKPNLPPKCEARFVLQDSTGCSTGYSEVRNGNVCCAALQYLRINQGSTIKTSSNNPCYKSGDGNGYNDGRNGGGASYVCQSQASDRWYPPCSKSSDSESAY